jgi:two-component system, chemotaxis family, chemotaxis protein CheY
MNSTDQPIAPGGGNVPKGSDCPSEPPRLRCMVVDDDPIFQLIIRSHLEEMGFPVAVADNGSAALKLCPQFKPNVVILDMFMPEKEGIETIPALKRIDPTLEILAISGGGVGDRELWLKTARLVGARHVLRKPFTRQEFSDALSVIMQHSPMVANLG